MHDVPCAGWDGGGGERPQRTKKEIIVLDSQVRDILSEKS